MEFCSRAPDWKDPVSAFTNWRRSIRKLPLPNLILVNIFLVFHSKSQVINPLRLFSATWSRSINLVNFKSCLASLKTKI